MKAYKVEIRVYDYWKNEDRGGFKNESKYFTNREKAETYAEEFNNNPWMYGFKDIENITKDSIYFIPVKKEKIEEIEIF